MSEDRSSHSFGDFASPPNWPDLINPIYGRLKWLEGMASGNSGSHLENKVYNLEAMYNTLRLQLQGQNPLEARVKELEDEVNDLHKIIAELEPII